MARAIRIARNAALILYALALVCFALALFMRPASAYDAVARARIWAGENHCPNCDLTNANLEMQCVKEGDLSGAKFDGAQMAYMCMRNANFSGASFRKADLTGANMSHSNLANADFTDAKFSITLIRGTNLATAKGLTQAQLDNACGDAETKLPKGLQVHVCQ